MFFGEVSLSVVRPLTILTMKPTPTHRAARHTKVANRPLWKRRTVSTAGHTSLWVALHSPTRLPLLVPATDAQGAALRHQLLAAQLRTIGRDPTLELCRRRRRRGTSKALGGNNTAHGHAVLRAWLRTTCVDMNLTHKGATHNALPQCHTTKII